MELTKKEIRIALLKTILIIFIGIVSIIIFINIGYMFFEFLSNIYMNGEKSIIKDVIIGLLLYDILIGVIQFIGLFISKIITEWN